MWKRSRIPIISVQDDIKQAVLIYTHSDQLGDALLKLPAIAALRNAFPDRHITWFAGSGPSIFARQLAPLIDGMVDEVRDDLRMGRHWRELLHRPLGGRYYDTVIDTQNIVRCTLILRRIPHRLFISSAAGFRFSDKRPGRGEKYAGSLARRLITLIQLASGRKITPAPRLNLPQSCREAAARLLPAGPVYIGLVPGAGDRRKCWPLERYIELAGRQVRKRRVPVFFIGPDELQWLAAIRAAVPGAVFPEQDPSVSQIRGPLLSIALAERITLGIANDSGGGHLLAAGGRPLVSLFGHTGPEKFIDRPAQRIIIQARDYGGKEMSLIPVNDVADKVDQQVLSTNRNA